MLLVIEKQGLSMTKLHVTDLIQQEAVSLLFSSALIGIAGAFIVTSLSLFLFQEIGVSALLVGFFFAIRALSEIVADLLISYISEGAYQRHHIAMLCTLLSAGGALWLVLVRDYYLLMFGSVILFGLGGAIFPQLFALTRDVAESKAIDVNAFNAFMRAINSAAWVIGPAVAFFLINTMSFHFLYSLAALFYLTAVLALGLGGFTQRQMINRQQAVSFRWRDLTYRSGSIMVFVLLLLTIVMIYQINIALYVSQELKLETYIIGLIIGIGAALEIPLILLFGFLASRFSKQKLLLFAAANACLFFVLLSFSNSIFALILIQIPNAIWVSIVLSLPVVMLQDELKHFHGIASALFSSAFKFGTFFGGAIGGFLLAKLGFQLTFLFCALLSLIAGAAILASPNMEKNHAS